MPSQAARQMAKASIIFQTIQDNPPLQDVLAVSTTVNQKTFFISKLLIALPGAFSDRTEPPPHLFDILTIWFGKLKGAPDKYAAVATALKTRKLVFLHMRNIKQDFIHRIGLSWSPATRDSFLMEVEPFFLPRLTTPYPRIKQWICESATIDDKWRSYLKYDPRAQPDKRQPRKPIFRMDPHQLSLDIGPDKSAIVYDANTGELIMLVLRDFCAEPDLLSHIEGVIKKAVECRRSIRVSCLNK
jgi:hypothetical protein